MRVRIYHDAHLVEALEWATTHGQPERSGGNPEKRQWRDAGQPERSGGNPEKRQWRDAGQPDSSSSVLDYTEGAEVGLRWYAAKGLRPQFAFGYGLSYTRFAYSAVNVSGGRKPKARFTVTNTGTRVGRDVPQLYLVAVNGKPLLRLAGFRSVTLRPGESQVVTLDLDPRLLANWAGDGFQVAGGLYEFALGRSAVDLGTSVSTHIPSFRP
jgi:beta-glucosidase